MPTTSSESTPLLQDQQDHEELGFSTGEGEGSFRSHSRTQEGLRVETSNHRGLEAGTGHDIEHDRDLDDEFIREVDKAGTVLEWGALRQESGKLLSLSLPVIGSYLISYLNNMAPILTMGHLGTKYLAAISLTTMTANITGFSIGYGLSTALDTLCAQAYTGAADKKALGNHLQRALLVQAAASIPILVLWCYTEEILLLLGQDLEIARLSAFFMKFMMPGLLPQLWYNSILRYLQAQSIMKASLLITLVSVPINFFLQILFVYGIGGFGQIGPEGACVATSITYILNLLMIIIYAAYFEGYECWGM
jgi:MATE family multidrug resistance protein